MKSFAPLFLSAVLIGLSACQPAAYTPAETEICRFADSTAYATVHINAEFPTTDTPAQQQIRDELTIQLANQSFQLVEGEDMAVAQKEIKTDVPSGQFIESLGKQIFSDVEQAARSDAEDRASYILSSEEYTEEEKNAMLADVPGWACDISLRRIEENENYIIYLSENYVYMGGAHGGVTGAGHLTFDTETGFLFTRFLTDEAEEALQPALRKGLKSYFTESDEELAEIELDELLFVENGWIPLPQYQPYPTAEGLVLTYMQYEIAPYAAGMPSFTIPYDVLMPYLTPDALQLLNLKR